MPFGKPLPGHIPPAPEVLPPGFHTKGLQSFPPSGSSSHSIPLIPGQT